MLPLRKELVVERLWLILSIDQNIDTFSNTSTPHSGFEFKIYMFHVNGLYTCISAVLININALFIWSYECLIVQETVLLNISVIYWSYGNNSSVRASLGASKLVKRTCSISMG